ncbi:MAG: hypothetical protein K8U57_37795 [Planctomycetes bacterium]|nr:hypothetical protein [Planctomycetota bacterium]
MGIVSLPLTVAVAAIEGSGELGEDPAQILVAVEHGRFRVLGASQTRMLAVTGLAFAVPDGQRLFTVAEFTDLIATARATDAATVRVSLDSDPLPRACGPANRIMHVPELLKAATSGKPIVSLSVDASDLLFAAQQAAQFADSDGQIRIEYRNRSQLVLTAGPATVLVLAIEAEPRSKAQPTNGAAARPSATPTRRSAKPITQTVGG